MTPSIRTIGSFLRTSSAQERCFSVLASRKASSFAGRVDSIFYLIYFIVTAWFILVLGVLPVFLFLYRRREGRRVSYVSGNTLR